MPELRFHMLTGDFVIIATERAKRPSEFRAAQLDEGPVREHDPKCPFCPGNEGQTPPEIYALREGTAANEQGWKVRVVPNKFPALLPLAQIHPSEVQGLSSSLGDSPGVGDAEMYWQIPSVGAHEVVIESPRHDGTLGTYSIDEIVSILEVLRDRSLVLYDRKEIKYVQIFRNWGKLGGASLSHPHFQIMGLPVVPPRIVNETSRFRLYEHKTKRCLICDLIERELEKDERVVAQTDAFVTLCPYASEFSFETALVPRKHSASVFGSTAGFIRELAQALSDLFARYERSFSSLSYNLIFHDLHDLGRDKSNAPFHGHIHVYPRLNVEAGLELGAGVHINPSPPEAAAQQLRTQI